MGPFYTRLSLTLIGTREGVTFISDEEDGSDLSMPPRVGKFG